MAKVEGSIPSAPTIVVFFTKTDCVRSDGGRGERTTRSHEQSVCLLGCRKKGVGKLRGSDRKIVKGRLAAVSWSRCCPRCFSFSCLPAICPKQALPASSDSAPYTIATNSAVACYERWDKAIVNSGTAIANNFLGSNPERFGISWIVGHSQNARINASAFVLFRVFIICSSELQRVALFWPVGQRGDYSRSVANLILDSAELGDTRESLGVRVLVAHRCHCSVYGLASPAAGSVWPCPLRMSTVPSSGDSGRKHDSKRRSDLSRFQ